MFHPSTQDRSTIGHKGGTTSFLALCHVRPWYTRSSRTGSKRRDGESSKRLRRLHLAVCGAPWVRPFVGPGGRSAAGSGSAPKCDAAMIEVLLNPPRAGPTIRHRDGGEGVPCNLFSIKVRANHATSYDRRSISKAWVVDASRTECALVAPRRPGTPATDTWPPVGRVELGQQRFRAHASIRLLCVA
jgi:hypothetical protein